MLRASTRNVEIANRTHSLRANVGKLFECCGIHFDARRDLPPSLGHRTMTTLT